MHFDSLIDLCFVIMFINLPLGMRQTELDVYRFLSTC